MKQGRVIILGGTPRAGKTTLANKLSLYGFNCLSFDNISGALRSGFPEIIIEDWTDQETCTKKKYPFFESLIGSFVENAKIYGLNYVVDMFDFTPEYVRKLPFQKETEVYFLGYPGQSVEEIRRNIQFYAEPTDWIAQVDEEYLTLVAKRCYSINEKLLTQCAEHGYDLINTGAGDSRGVIIDRLFEKITAGA